MGTRLCCMVIQSHATCASHPKGILAQPWTFSTLGGALGSLTLLMALGWDCLPPTPSLTSISACLMKAQSLKLNGEHSFQSQKLTSRGSSMVGEAVVGTGVDARTSSRKH